MDGAFPKIFGSFRRNFFGLLIWQGGITNLFRTGSPENFEEIISQNFGYLPSGKIFEKTFFEGVWKVLLIKIYMLFILWLEWVKICKVSKFNKKLILIRKLFHKHLRRQFNPSPVSFF